MKVPLQKNSSQTDRVVYYYGWMMTPPLSRKSYVMDLKDEPSPLCYSECRNDH